MSHVELNVKCGKECVSLKVFREDFQFMEFDRWMRNRFNLSSSAKIIFKDIDGNECLPTKGFLMDNTDLIVEQFQEKAAVVPAIASKASPLVINSIEYYLVAIAILIAIVYRYAYMKPFFDGLSVYEEKLVQMGAVMKKGSLTEAFLSAFSWGLSYLYVRRAWNPENTKDWYSKYRLDSIFGGLAAGAAVLIKGYITTCLQQQ
mmetsp:Transcript_3017/g.4691  ORF Transcript_3017/g.4691 Transcript_3017/m.4691 type:complete len:203 (-) Transcript_3017:1007-1615(-)